MNSNQDTFGVREGAEVISANGKKLGKVDRLEGDMIVVRKGMFFPKDQSIPISAVASADDDHVYLSGPIEAVLAGDWGQAGAVADGTTGMDDMKVDPEPFEHEQDSQRTHANEEDELLVPVSEEEMVASTRPVERGEVRVNKNVVEEEQSIDIPVTEEEVEVTRRRVDREATADDHVFEDGTIEVPVRGEEVNVEKRNRVVEEIDIDKTARTRNKRVSDTVRREEVQIEGDDEVERVVGKQDRGTGKRTR